MILYAMIAVFTVFMGFAVRVMPEREYGTWTRRQAVNGVSLFTIFTVLFAVSACRVNVGNDYAKYVEFMHLIACRDYAAVPTEFGFNALTAILYQLSGFENFLLVFAVFSFFTLLFFLAAIYRQSDHFGFSFYLFMAFGFYFQTFNTVRYYLALAIALYSIPYVLKKEWGKFILLVLAGSLFHKSLLVILPLYFLAQIAWKKWQIAICALFCTSFFFLQDFYLKLVVFLYPTYEDTEYLEGGISYFNILRCLGVLILALIYYKQSIKGNKKNTFYFYCNLGALVLYTCCYFLPIVTRIGYYLNITQILLLPSIIRKIPDKRQRIFFTVLVGVAAAGYFILFLFRADNDGIRVLPYQTFMFHDMVPILSDMN